MPPYPGWDFMSWCPVESASAVVSGSVDPKNSYIKNLDLKNDDRCLVCKEKLTNSSDMHIIIVGDYAQLKRVHIKHLDEVLDIAEPDDKGNLIVKTTTT